MIRRLMGVVVACLVCAAPVVRGAEDELGAGFAKPPIEARLRAYWWWLNGNVNKAAITKDMEWMKEIGMGGGLVFDAGGATQGGHNPVPAGPLFGTPEWRELLKHTLKEADRLGLELTLSAQSGWNLGGPVVTPEMATKHISFAEMQIKGPKHYEGKLPETKVQGFYRDTYVLALKLTKKERPKPISQLASKSMFHELGGSATDTTPLLMDIPSTPGEQDVLAKDVIDITEHRGEDGTLKWDVPAGNWVVLRFGYKNNGFKVSTSSGKWQGMVVDYMDPEALKSYWRAVVDPILAEVGPAAGKTLKGLQTDSWEGGGINWSAKFPEEFKKRRGYDMKGYLPVIAGYIVESRDASNRFLADWRKTIGQCMADNHYGLMAEMAHQHGMMIHCEAGGPHAGPFDSLQNLGRTDAPMGEFWVPSPHRPTEQTRFFMKVAASAAHIYGKKIACGEGFTSIGPHWNDNLWQATKPTFDHEACAGLNLTYWHAFTCSPPEMGIPGQEYFAGTHFDPQITWARQAHVFVSYLNRSQFLLQQGKFVADVCYYYGDHVPNIVQRKQADPAGVLPTYDYDVMSEEVLLNRLSVKDGRLVLPDGMSYRVLVLPGTGILSIEAARKVKELVEGGATVVGPRPVRTATLTNYPACDAELKRIAEELWDKGRVISGKSVKDVLAGLKVAADFESPAELKLDYIHRRVGEAEVYFVSNPRPQAVTAACTFRVSDKQPEIWDAVSGERRDAAAFSVAEGRTTVPLEFSPNGSWFVIFRKPVSGDGKGRNFLAYKTVAEVGGPWTVSFNPKWGGPESATFEKLVSWTSRPEEGIKFYSGTGTYRKTFDRPEAGGRLFLDLGEVMNIAEVRLNGKAVGTLWCPPFRVEITEAVQAKENKLEIDVINTWYNRFYGDAKLPPAKRFTKTNIVLTSYPAKGKQITPPPDSGLLGPVLLQSVENIKQ